MIGEYSLNTQIEPFDFPFDTNMQPRRRSEENRLRDQLQGDEEAETQQSNTFER